MDINEVKILLGDLLIANKDLGKTIATAMEALEYALGVVDGKIKADQEKTKMYRRFLEIMRKPPPQTERSPDGT